MMNKDQLKMISVYQNELEEAVREILPRYLETLTDADEDFDYISSLNAKVSDLYHDSEYIVGVTDNIQTIIAATTEVIVNFSYEDIDWDDNQYALNVKLGVPNEWLYDEDFRLRAEDAKLAKVVSYKAQQETFKTKETGRRRSEYLKLKEEFGDE